MLPVLLLALLSAVCDPARPEVLTPPYFNLAENRNIWATATCGYPEPELYCKLAGADNEPDINNFVIQGQMCDYCNYSNPDKRHPPEHAVDGQETWWQSPPLSRGRKYNEVNLTIELGQEFHVAYVIVKMGNSPRPDVWVLERSADNAQTYHPWQYFADSVDDCKYYFGNKSIEPISADDSVFCDTSVSKIVPLENGEIFVKLLANRPSANNFFNSSALQEFTRATHVRFRFLKVKNLLGHLIPVANKDPATTRRYFYSIKDVSIGGRCRCNGHADVCDPVDPKNPNKLICDCRHNTCGDNCEYCCPGYEQKAWSQSKYDQLFECEPCNCFGHSETCVYDNATDASHLSIDIHGKYEGGGICKNCRDHTTGINCDKCDFGFYRPFGKQLNDTDVCQPCKCDYFNSTGNCSDETGKCECKEAYASPDCDECSEGYYGYPNCTRCECYVNGTSGRQCENTGGQCTCKENFGGEFCYQCADGFYNFPECKQCNCHEIGCRNPICDQKTGQCSCRSNYGNLLCDQCNDGYYGFPACSYCNCDLMGSLPEVCNKSDGQCLCKEGYAGPRCDKCLPGYNGYPDCQPCGCSERGSASSNCDASGKCPCLPSFAGRTCEQCSPGYYQYPECKFCDCNSQGSIGVSCDNEGKCSCKPNFWGTRCDMCKEGLYNFPICEECKCNPAGVLATFAGCGSLPLGELCQCKPRVHGRICDECRELYWNLEPSNPEGCQDCDCFMPGVLSGVGVCNPKSGQCICKPSATSRRCDECVEGFYSLNENSLFGCTECDCNVGGSINEVCDKTEGQCFCQPRIVGRACDEPMQAHYFPTLHQFTYEAEDSRTTTYTPVRYGFDEKFFPEYSWKGYAVFSQLQNEIVYELNVDRSSIYRIVLKYVNLNNETLLGSVSITPETPNEVNSVQTFGVQLKPTKTPTFVTVSGPIGNIPSPFVMNPGRWAVTIKINHNVFVDYFVILPAEYYEGNILVDKVLNPCVIDNIESGLCRHFDYPSISKFVKSPSALTLDNEEPVDFIGDKKQLDVLGVQKLPVISETQPELKLELSISDPGPYVILINYMTPSSIQMKAVVKIEVDEKMNTGKAILYACHHTTLCRQAAVDATGKVAIFDINKQVTQVILKGGEDHSTVGIESIVAVPLEKWSLEYINPNPSCIKKDGQCIQSTYTTPPDTKKIEFKTGNEGRLATVVPKDIYNSTALIALDHDDTINLTGKVPGPGEYVFVVHFYQPDFPAFEINALIHNGQTYDVVLPVKHCPSNSGCRSIIKQANGNTQFQLNENFSLTLKEPNKNVWLEYVLVVPAQEYRNSIIAEQPFDYTGLFISKCGSNHFFINTSTTGFCKEATFSLTTAYNSGAFPCQCDYEGSLSFVCDPYGGQCQCKPNVIGRQCTACKNGYYGFPECKTCNCPSVATCETTTGECICPPRVTGENCDQCEPMTYGFDPIIGCEECDCNYKGVENGNLQCDLFDGSCECKQNIIGRACDHCLSGHWSFPDCKMCNCDLRGTTSEICEQKTAECFCKSNVDGQACDVCKEGTFNIQEKNHDGCSKCFCFGKTTRCQSSDLYRTEIVDMNNWSLKTININNKVITSDDVKSSIEQIEENVLGVDLTKEELQKKITYFFAPAKFLGNQLKSYGGFLNFTIHYTLNFIEDGRAVIGPDVILFSRDIYLLYFSLELPTSDTMFPNSVEIIEQNFVLTNGQQATREQLMQVLQNLNGLYIRATYWEPTLTTSISSISLETAQEEYIPSKEIALPVEQCQCPANYVGLSCEECADGFYRAQTGPYGGYCVPCQCNGHSTTCDKITGICDTCNHNTTGDHCEKCIIGYHGNATVGTPYDCLICACPLPIASNNFATSCEVSPDGYNISCDCIPGYFGARCESCNAGYYGSPEIPGEVCKECKCSGNINKEDRGSCDSITGKCTRCLNNTFGETCQYCRPGFFGDAVKLKDCQECDCDTRGMEKCDNRDGQCVCKQNVEGVKCDRCAVNHYGFGTEEGCTPCNCALASESSQCDGDTGMCRCKPGVAGRTCDRCIHGYWNYTEEGCKSCGCNSEYSLGASCNSQTGRCECLPGVIGDKCDHCPHRWVYIQPKSIVDQNEAGCFECDTCTHSLLNVTDSLFAKLYPLSKDFKNVELGNYTTKRLLNINETVSKLKPSMKELISSSTDKFPLNDNLKKFHTDISYLNSKSESALSDAILLASKGEMTFNKAIDVGSAVNQAEAQTNKTVIEVTNLMQSLQEIAGPQIDLEFKKALEILEHIKKSLPNIMDKIEKSKIALNKSTELHKKMSDIIKPLNNPSRSLKSIQNEIETFQDHISDIKNFTKIAKGKSDQAESKNFANRESLMKQNEKLNSLANLKDAANEAMNDLIKTVKDASDDLHKSREAFAKLGTENESMKATQIDVENEIKREIPVLEKIENDLTDAKKHSEKLKEQAELMESLVKISASETTVAAANSYKNIESKIEKALDAAKNASMAANDAMNKSKGLDERVASVKQDSTQLLEDIEKASGDQGNLKNALDDAQQNLSNILNSKSLIDEREKKITKQLEDPILTKSQDVTSDENVQSALDSGESSRELINKLNDIVKSLPNQLVASQQLNKENTNAIKDYTQSKNQLDLALSLLSNATEIANRLKDKSDAKKENVTSTMEKLQENIKICRESINGIKVGISLSKNSNIELRYPENVNEQGISTLASIYFKTNQLNGLIMYLGNEAGTGRNKRRAVTDDFMALQVVNGHLVLLMDIGSGISTVTNYKYVSDNKWYKATVERIGKTVRLTVYEDTGIGSSTQEERYMNETILPGNSFILNLDKDRSKLFVGGLPSGFDAHGDIVDHSLEGQVEDLKLGNVPVGLWNFVNSTGENSGAIERDKFIDSSSAFRMNGEGFVVLNAIDFELRFQSTIAFKLKTIAWDGLIFLAFKDDNFMSIELENGKIVYRLNLGEGTSSTTSQYRYNDNKWHWIDASKSLNKFKLTVDGNDTTKMPAEVQSSTNEFKDPEYVYLGGYPEELTIKNVTKSKYDGCLDNVKIARVEVKPNNKYVIQAYGYTPGCPVQDNLVSFDGNKSYVRWPNVTASDNSIELILRFKTSHPNGLLVYGVDGSSLFSLRLESGMLTFESGEIKVSSTKPTPYNDSQWHVVLVAHTNEQLLLIVDDFENYQPEKQPKPVRFLYSDFYFGGVPSDINNSIQPFAGCISDVTFNGEIIQFESLTDKHGAIIGQCTRLPLFVEESNQKKKNKLPLKDTDGSMQSITSTSFPPTFAPDDATTEHTSPLGLCALSADPKEDQDLNKDSGFRFGNSVESRFEYDSSIIETNIMSVDVKTTESDGIIFFAHQVNGPDMIAVYLTKGLVRYRFSCNSELTTITGEMAVNNGDWHSIVWTQPSGKAQLFVDNMLVGFSKSEKCELNISSPIYIGGTNRSDNARVIESIGTNATFVGCMRKIVVNSEENHPDRKYGVIRCSDKVEKGAFFHGNGGYIKLFNKFALAKDIQIKMSIKSRSMDGILMAMKQTKKNVPNFNYFLLLEMKNGSISFTIDFGKGPTSNTFTPPSPNYFCDGQWHTIEAWKYKNLVNLKIDDLHFNQNKVTTVHSSQINQPLFIGGHPKDDQSIRYLGCIRDIQIKNAGSEYVFEKFHTHSVQGDVALSVCPTI